MRRPCGYSASSRLRTRSSGSWMLSGDLLRDAVGREQAVHQRLQAVGLLHDDLRVLGQLRAFELALQQLRRAAQPAERVLDLVREVADQRAARLGLVVQPLLARDAQLLVQSR